jgi:hypothetical protein
LAYGLGSNPRVCRFKSYLGYQQAIIKRTKVSVGRGQVTNL